MCVYCIMCLGVHVWLERTLTYPKHFRENHRSLGEATGDADAKNVSFLPPRHHIAPKQQQHTFLCNIHMQVMHDLAYKRIDPTPKLQILFDTPLVLEVFIYLFIFKL